MPLLGGISRFLDKYLFGYALGVASGPSLAPFVQPLANEANAAIQAMPLRPGDAAEIVAEDVELQAWGRTEAAQMGVNTERFDALTSAVRNAPGLAQLFELWRRNLISDGDFRHGLRKARLEPRWDAALFDLKQRLISPQELAMMRQQGFIGIDRQHSESALQGVDVERADLYFEVSGLPPGIAEALQMLRRGIIGEAEFAQIVREGHTKTKYTDELLALRRVLLTASQNVNAAIRGWITLDEMHTRNASLGYTREDSQLLFDEGGRPPGPGQLQTAFNRGIIDHARFDHGIRESSVRPEWLDVEFALRHRYPPLFQLGRLAMAGALPPARVRTILGYEGYEDQDADAFVAYWTANQTSSNVDPVVRSAQTNALLRIRNVYTQQRADEAQARDWLGQLGLAATVQDDLVSVWNVIRQIPGAGLTRAQLKKAFNELPTQWPRQRVLDELVALGMEPEEAQTYLDE